jgi:copper chaperone NosL
MRTGTRLVAVLAAIALGLAFVLPLWRITLEAPQYPEGIGMQIYVNTIAGATPHDLQNINGLNHYVGMARIEADSFAELRWMPWILGGLLAFGLAVAAIGSRRLLVTWAAVFALAAGAGLIDFYRWEYAYGHDLNPKAAIKVPGLAYQPPLIGSKKLLNFTAHSWPAAGGWLAIAAFGAVATAAVLEMRNRRQTRDPATPGPAGNGGPVVVNERVTPRSISAMPFDSTTPPTTARGAGSSGTRSRIPGPEE